MVLTKRWKTRRLLLEMKMRESKKSTLNTSSRCYYVRHISISALPKEHGATGISYYDDFSDGTSAKV